MPSTSILDKPVVLERKGKERDSTGKARAIFLQGISELRPCVINDLYEKVYCEFVYAVAEHFKHELFAKAVRTSGKSDAFLLLAKGIIDGIEESDEVAPIATLPKPVRDSFIIPRVYWLNLHLQGQLSDPMLIEIVSLPLMRLIGRLRQLGEERIREVFPDWRALNHSKAIAFRNTLWRWSVKWNLNGNWCRDHALTVLHEWLSDETLRWTYLPYISRTPRLVQLWHFTARNQAFSANLSQAVLSGMIHKGNPDPFIFSWRGVTFQAQGLNLLIESMADWKKRVTLDFRVTLHGREIERLQTLKANGSQYEETDLSNRFTGLLRVFSQCASKHAATMKQRFAEAEQEHGLIKVSRKPNLSQHLAWAIRYQVPTSGPDGRESESEIAKSFGVTLPAVSKAVSNALATVKLRKRLTTDRGRKLGSKNNPLTGNQILKKFSTAKSIS